MSACRTNQSTAAASPNYFTGNHAHTYCYTGGKPFDAAKPTAIFIHGVLNKTTACGFYEPATKVNVFYTGFKACDSYENGLQAIIQVTCPVLFVLGQADQMTPPKAAQGLIKGAQNAQVVYLPGGHQQMNETPEDLLAALTVTVPACRPSKLQLCTKDKPIKKSS